LGMPRSLENRSLDRGLTILNSLSLQGASSLQDLHADTTLPKSTIRRILATLIRRKVVRRSLNDRLYRANISLPVESRRRATRREGWLVDCAVSHMIELTRAVGWSCDLHIFERRTSRVVESTRPLTPFMQYERRIDLEVPVFASAAGLAALSTWNDRAVLKLVDEIGDHPVWGLSRLGMTGRDLLGRLQAVRTLGYATRASQYLGETVNANKLNAIACPVLRGQNAVGALVILWPKRFLSVEKFAGIHLNDLHAATAAITADLTRGDQG
jgi:IclR family mhp operon transcriptional activator